MNIQEHAYQLTAYEVGGYIDFRAYLKDCVREQLEDTDFDTMLEAYNFYCGENSYEEFLNNDEELFETYFKNSLEAVRATHYGDYNFAHDYVKFNGYGNLDSYNDFEVELEILEDTSFHNYIIDWLEDFSFIDLRYLIDNKKEILKEAYNLVKQGY